MLTCSNGTKRRQCYRWASPRSAGQVHLAAPGDGSPAGLVNRGNDLQEDIEGGGRDLGDGNAVGDAASGLFVLGEAYLGSAGAVLGCGGRGGLSFCDSGERLGAAQGEQEYVLQLHGYQPSEMSLVE